MIKFSRAGFDDIEPLIALISDVFSGVSVSKQINLSVPDIADSVANCIKYPNRHTAILAKKNGEIVGLAKGVINKFFFSDEFVLGDHVIWVHPFFYGAGIGEVLLSHLEKWGKENGAKSAMFDVAIGIDNERAKSFFVKNGFDMTGYNFYKVM